MKGSKAAEKHQALNPTIRNAAEYSEMLSAETLLANTAKYISMELKNELNEPNLIIRLYLPTLTSASQPINGDRNAANRSEISNK